jgi:hypothetical protein
MDARFVRSLTAVNATRRPGMETYYVESGGGSLDRGRNLLVQKFLELGDHPWLLQLDTDMYFGIEEYDRLLETAADKDIVSGLYFANERPPRPAMYRWAEDGSAKSVTEWEDHDVLEVDGCGAGFLLVRREVYEKMNYPEKYNGRAGSWFNQDKHGPVGQLMNEDNAFCMRAQEHGYKIYVDTDCFVGHIKTRVLGWE